MLNANGVKSITRSGTTFTVTRNDNTTFTFTQQDSTYGLASTTANGLLRQLNGNTAQYMRGDGTWQTPPNTNTWKQNTNAQEGYVVKGVANKVWKCDANGNPAWRDDANTTYGLASTSANGLLRQLNGNTAQYMRGDGTWQTPPNTNTWRGIQNNLTSTSTTDSLAAAQGKALRDLIINTFKDYVYLTDQTSVISSGSIAANSYATYQKAYTPPSGYAVSNVTGGFTHGHAWILCSNAYYDGTNKKLVMTANNTAASTANFSSSYQLTIVWRIMLRKTNPT